MLTIVRRSHALAALLFAGLLGVSLASLANEAVDTRSTVTDLLGRKVKVNLPVKRVILGEGRQLYLVAALDTQNPIERIVGWRKDLIQSDPDTYNAYLRKFPGIADIPTFGGFEDGTFDIEQAISQRPDVIVLNGVVCGRGRNPTLRLWPTIFSGKIDVFPGDRRSRLISSMTSVAPA